VTHLRQHRVRPIGRTGEENAVTVNVHEVQTRVVAAPPSAEQSKPAGGQPKPGAAEEAWAAAYRLVQRDGCRTSARDFDD
jgi:hypothetical protein